MIQMKNLNKYFVKFTYRKNGITISGDSYVMGYDLKSEEGIDKLRKGLKEVYHGDDYSVVIEFIWRLNS